MNLDLRNGLYVLFRDGLDGAAFDSFRWLGAFSEELRKSGSLSVPRARLSEAGRSLNLSESTLDSLCSGPLLFERGGEIRFRFAPSDLAYLEDRVPRFLRALSNVRPPQSDLEEIRIGQELFNAGLFFECHEYLESLWRRADGPLKRLVQGLIQAGAGFHKFELGSPSGAAGLLHQAAEKLEGPPEEGLDPRPFARALRESAEALQRGTLLLERAPRMTVLSV